jgi:thioester reductase-like protein
MNASPVLGPPHLIPDSALLKLVTRHQKLRSIFLPPAVIEQLLHEPNGIDFFKGLDFLVYSGAPFSPAIGDRLSKVIEIISPFGSTEVFPQPELAPSPEDWAYHEFNPFIKHKMELYDATEGTFELVILVDESVKNTAATYHNLPGVSEYHTKDLFVQHPLKPKLYKYYGRRDDIIVLANGEKFNPIPLEVNVQNHPSLKGAFVIGNGRRQAALLVEPKEPLDESRRRSLLDELWPLVSKSNDLVPGQGRIQRGRIICGLPEKPFTRTGKGTIVRKLTEETYKQDIDQLYLDTSSQAIIGTVELQPTVTYELPNVVSFCRNIISASFPVAATIDSNEDFVMYGLDSEQTVEIVSSLKRNLRGRTDKPVDWISPRTVFRNSTVTSLSRLLQDFLNEGSIPEEDLELFRTSVVDDVVARYSEGLPAKALHREETLGTVSAVAVIGSTGYLGGYIVATLIKDANISRVFCLNRLDNARAKQEASLLELDASIGQFLEKLVFMTIDLEHSNLGLSPENAERIVNEVDVIVFNAWNSNFVLPIRSFNPFLNAMPELIRLAASSPRRMRIVFVSSLASVGSMARNTTVPEALVQDSLAALNNGYGQSKLAAERILATGYQQSGVPVTIVRVTQIGGPTHAYSGKWAEQGWIWAIAKTSKAVNSIPSNGPLIDWLPVDTVAEMLHEYTVHPAHSGVHFYNMRHPNPRPWNMLVEILTESLEIQHTVPFQQWIKELRDTRSTHADDKASMPALTLLDYYEEEYKSMDIPTYDTDLAMKDSRVVVPDLDVGMVKAWLNGWDV